MTKPNKPNRTIVTTIADNGAIDGLKYFVQSIINQGYKESIHIHTTKKGAIQKLPTGCINIYMDSPDIKISSKVSNKIAILKPSLFLSPMYRNGDLILYADCYDLAFFIRPDKIFEQMDGKDIAAVEGNQVQRYAQKFKKEIAKKYNLDLSLMHGKPVINSGLIIVRISEATLGLMRLWRDLLYGMVSTHGSMLGPKKLGDQVLFNYAYRIAEKQGLTKSFGEEYNYTSGNSSRDRVEGLVVREGRLYDKKGKQIFIPHHSGPHKLLPPHILTLIEEESDDKPKKTG